MTDHQNGIWNDRQNAPLHYWAKAENARFSACALHHANDEYIKIISKSISYNGKQKISLREGFLREASIAVELAIKAIIAQKIKDTPEEIPHTHNIAKLWKIAKLPILDRRGHLSLLQMGRVLYWMGRYPAPSNFSVARTEAEEINKFSISYENFTSKLPIRKGWKFDWGEFEEIFSLLNDEFMLLIETY